LLALGLNWLALLSWRRSEGRHWTERARLLYPAQKSAGFNSWLIPANLGILSSLVWPDDDFALVIFPGFFGALAASYFVSLEVQPGLKFKQWLHLIAAIGLLSFVWWFVLFYAVCGMPDNFRVWTWIWAAVVLAVLLGLNLGLGIHILRWLRLLKPATNHLNSLVSEVSQKMGVPVRASWIFSTHISNALAFPLTKQLIFTDRLLSTLSDEEIKAVCAHELGHLNEPRKVLLMRLLVSLAFFPLIFVKPLNSVNNDWWSAFMMLLIGVLIMRFIGIRLSRRMEKRADKIAAENMVDKVVYAQALERLYEINQTPAVMPRRATKIHPDLYDRMIAAGVTPDYPKPAPAKGLFWTTYLMLFSLFLSPVMLFIIKFIGAVLDGGTIHVD
jgi:Zn-dependent protease with chaperone function